MARFCQANTSPWVNEIRLKSSFVLMRGCSSCSLPFITSMLWGLRKSLHIVPKAPPALTEGKQTLIRWHGEARQGRKIAVKVLIFSGSLSFPARWDIDRKSVNSSQWQLHGFCIINYLYQARHSNYHPDEYDILISYALILIALQHLTVSGGLAWWSEDSPKSIRHLPEDQWLRSPLFLPICFEINMASLFESVCTCVRSHPSHCGLVFLSQM